MNQPTEAELAQTMQQAFRPPITAMDFGDAVRALKNGHKVKRAEWTEIHINLDGRFLQMCGRSLVVPFAPSSVDILATDWVIA